MIKREIKNIGEHKTDKKTGFAIELRGIGTTQEEIQALENEMKNLGVEHELRFLEGGTVALIATIIFDKEPIIKLADLLNKGWNFHKEDLLVSVETKYQVEISTVHNRVLTIIAQTKNEAREQAIASIQDDPSLSTITGIWINGEIEDDFKSMGGTIIAGTDELISIDQARAELKDVIPSMDADDMTAGTIAKATKSKCEELEQRGIIVGNMPFGIIGAVTPSEAQKKDATDLIEQIMAESKADRATYCQCDNGADTDVKVNPDAVDYVTEAKRFMAGEVVALPNDPEVLSRFMAILNGDEKNG